MTRGEEQLDDGVTVGLKIICDLIEAHTAGPGTPVMVARIRGWRTPGGGRVGRPYPRPLSPATLEMTPGVRPESRRELEKVKVAMRTWTVDDVMTTEVVAVPPTAGYRELVDLMIGHRFSAVPVVDGGRRVIGVVSETDLLCKIEMAGAGPPRLFEGRRRRGQRAKASAGAAGQLMSTPPVVVRRGTTIAEAARTMESENVKRLPVVDEQDRLAGIVTRGDLLRVHLRSDDDIRTDVISGVLGAFSADEVAPITVAVSGGVVTLTGRVMRWSTEDLLVSLTRQVPGVVRVADRVAFEFDDRSDVTSGRSHGLR